MDQNPPSLEAEPTNENAQSQAARDVELLWADRQSSPDEALLRGDLPDAAQVAEPAEPAQKHDLGGVPQDAGTISGAATAHPGKEGSTNALPDGIEFLPTADGFSEAGGNPEGACEGELK